MDIIISLSLYSLRAAFRNLNRTDLFLITYFFVHNNQTDLHLPDKRVLALCWTNAETDGRDLLFERK